MLRAAEGFQIDEHGVILRVAGVLAAQVRGVGVHGHDLGFDVLRALGQVDAVAQRLAHLRLAVDAGQAQAGLIFRQHDLRLDERFAVHAVEAAHDFPALLEHRQLILAHRHRRGAEGGDVRRLTDGIAEEAHRHAGLEIALLNFGLHRGVALHARHGDEVHIIEGQFRQLRNHRLDEKCALLRVEPAGEIVQRDVQNVLSHLLRMLGVVRQRLRVGDHDVDFVVPPLVLKAHALLQRADVVSHVQTAGRAVACQYNLLHALVPSAFLVTPSAGSRSSFSGLRRRG